ncbi:hypothetical protein F0U59_08915 [Archangium gephyra]|nr:hypothetical protein F0U59_08915 [Archangium gephyra]
MLGGLGNELGRALVLGASGEVYVAGTTTSLTIQWERPSGTQGSDSLGAADGFVARLAASGTELEWFQRVGGNGVDFIHNMLRTADGQLYVVGDTASTDLPDLRGSPGPIVGVEAFLTRVDPSASTPRVLWTVLLQGVGDETLYDLLDEGGFMYVTGSTTSFSSDGSQDVLVAVIQDIGSDPGIARQFHLGGSGEDEGRAVRLSGSGAQPEVRVFGTTRSDNFGGGARGGADVFVATYPTWSQDMTMRQKVLKRLGSSGEDILLCVSADASGQVYLGGTTTAVEGFPMTSGGFDTTYSGGDMDGFVARVGFEGEPAIQWASYVGGEGTDGVYAVRVDALDPTRLLLGGATTSKNLTYSGNGYSPGPDPNAVNTMLLLSVDLDDSPVPDGGTVGPSSPLGWSCGTTGPWNAPGAWGLVTIAGLGLFVSRRRKTLPPRA